MKLRNTFRRMFGDTRRQIDEMFESFEASFEEFDRHVEEAEREATPAGPGETVTTRREEVRPDGTRIVTTVTRSHTVVTTTERKS